MDRTFQVVEVETFSSAELGRSELFAPHRSDAVLAFEEHVSREGKAWRTYMLRDEDGFHVATLHRVGDVVEGGAR